MSNTVLRDFVFKGLIFDAECDRFRQAGIRMGIPSEIAEQDLMREALAPFSVANRSPALRMARLYAIIYCFENSVRELIVSRLLELKGQDWWAQAVPTGVQKYAESRKQDTEKNSWLEGETASSISYIDFGKLADFILHNWVAFEDLIPSQHWLKQRFGELEKVRNFIAHNRLLRENEFDRIEIYIADWSKQVGF